MVKGIVCAEDGKCFNKYKNMINRRRGRLFLSKEEKEKIAKTYKSGKSIKIISKMINHSYNFVIRTLFYEGVKIRTLSEALKQHKEEYSERMKINNPMFNPDISKKSILNRDIQECHKKTTETLKRIGHYKKISERMKYGGAIKALMGNDLKPNKPEKLMIDLIKENNLPFNYVGDGKIWFRGENHSFNPDFLSKNPKHIIEVFGDYWHSREDNKKRDVERLKTYSKYGYKTLVIWDYELHNQNEVIKKIKEFIR